MKRQTRYTLFQQGWWGEEKTTNSLTGYMTRTMVTVILYMSSVCAIRLCFVLRRKYAGMRAKHTNAITIRGVIICRINLFKKGKIILQSLKRPSTPIKSRFTARPRSRENVLNPSGQGTASYVMVIAENTCIHP